MATLYVNLEPCAHFGKTPPCANAIVEAGLKAVVVGTLDPNPLVAGQGVAILREAGIEVRVGVEEAACRWLNRRFFHSIEAGRPYILLKWAESPDGFIDGRPAASIIRALPVSSDASRALDAHVAELGGGDSRGMGYVHAGRAGTLTVREVRGAPTPTHFVVLARQMGRGAGWWLWRGEEQP